MGDHRMRFLIEQRQLTDDGGRPLDVEIPVRFHTCEAETSDEAVRIFVKKNDVEIMGDVMTFPGFQAVATVRKVNAVYTLQVSPTSQNNVELPRN